MKTKTLFFFILLFVSNSFGQIVPREILRGQVVSDSIEIERVTIFNISSNKGAVSDDLGYFTLYARPTDTLIFSSVIIKPTKLILTELDFAVKIMKVKLNVSVNELDEVIVSPYSLSGDLAKDNKNLKVTMINPEINNLEIKDLMLEGDQYSSPKNRTMPPDGSMEYAMDLKRIGKSIYNFFAKEKPKEANYTTDQYFQDVVKEKFTYHFFTETLGLKQDEIGLFLNYCENDSSVKKLLAPNKEIELIDFLISKSETFKKIPKN